VDPYIEQASDAPGSQPSSPKLNGNGKEEDSRLVHVTDHFIVSVPYSSSSQYSLTVAPRRHCAHFYEITDEEIKDLASVLALMSQAIYKGLDDPSYNVFIRTAPADDAGIKIGPHDEEMKPEDIRKIFHWIVEIRPRFPADLGGFEIASGIRVVSGLPEDHAKDLRGWVKERIEANVEPIKSEARKGSRPSTKQSGAGTGGSVSRRLHGQSVAKIPSLTEPIAGRSKSEALNREVERDFHPHSTTATAPVGKTPMDLH
jgi:hypothetical protein